MLVKYVQCAFYPPSSDVSQALKMCSHRCSRDNEAACNDSESHMDNVVWVNQLSSCFVLAVI